VRRPKLPKERGISSYPGLRRDGDLRVREHARTKPQPEGFSVTIRGRAGLWYAEGDHLLFVDSELLVGPAACVVWSRSIKAWEPPYEAETIDSAKRQSILENIRRWFRAGGNEIEID